MLCVLSFLKKMFTLFIEEVFFDIVGISISNFNRGNNLEEGDEGYYLFRGFY